MKYKLIKKYPGSPIIGHVFQIYENYKGDYHKHPEFWEKVVELNYKILSFKNKYNNEIYVNNGEYCNENHNTIGERTYDYCLKFYKIFSVKRLLDKKVFIINENTTFGIITNFRLLDNEIMVDFENKNSILLNSKLLQEAKSIFITEDGVNVFEGDKITSISKKNLSIFTKNGIISSINNLSENYLYFSTLKKAEEYILLNKPIFKTEDGVNVFENNNVFTVSIVNIADKYSLNKTIITSFMYNNWRNMFKYFSTKKAAEEYILMNKPCLSLKEALECNGNKSYCDSTAYNLKQLANTKING